MSDRVTPLREAVFQRFANGTSWAKLSAKFSLPEWQVRRAYQHWLKTPPESQPLDPTDIHIPPSAPGRPCTLNKEEECLIKDAVLYFVANNTPLSKEGLLDLVEHYIRLLPVCRQQRINFKHNRPSLQWLQSFLVRHNLSYRSVRLIDDKRIGAITKDNIAEHIGRVRAAIKRYNIRDGRRILNMDQSGVSFAKMVGRSLRKGIGSTDTALIHKSIQTKGNLERVTIMPIVSATGHSFTPVIVFPGVQAHYRRVNGVVQTIHDFLPDCYFHQREVPGVNKEIIFDWAKKFVAETTHLRERSQYLLLVIDGYGSHVQFSTLQLFKENRIVVIAMPSHSSHRLQPLDVSVFSAYKSYMQREVQKCARRKKVLNAFDVALCIFNAYTASHNSANIISGFRRTGIWDANLCDATVEPLLHLTECEDKENMEFNVTLTSLLKSFEKQERSLLRDADVEEGGTVKVQTKRGCHLTSDAVLEALQKRDLNRKSKDSTTSKQNLRDYKEPAKDIRHLMELANERSVRRKILDESRDERRFEQRLRASRRNMVLNGNDEGALAIFSESL